MILCISLKKQNRDLYTTMTLNSNEKYIVYNILQSKYDDLLATHFSSKFALKWFELMNLKQ